PIEGCHRGRGASRILGNLVDVCPAAVEDAGVAGDLHIDRRVEKAAAAAQHRLAITRHLPGGPESRRKIGVTWHRLRLTVPIDPTAKIEAQALINFPRVLSEPSDIMARTDPEGIVKSLPVEKRQIQ